MPVWLFRAQPYAVHGNHTSNKPLHATLGRVSRIRHFQQLLGERG
jgi:hypothetical protein